jgi:ferredoxin, 2Fe-2S
VPHITFISAAGARQEIEAESGMSIMAAAQHNGVAGIEAECGGSLSCGTCHVYLDDSCMDKVAAPSEAEIEMLDLVAAERRPGSRLSCQVRLMDDTAPLLVHVPATQY